MNINQPLLSTYNRKSAAVVFSIVALSVLSTLSACGKKDDSQSTVGQKLDAAVSRTEQAAVEAKAKAEVSIAKAGDAMKDAVKKAETTGAKTAESLASKADDAAITASISAEFAKDADLSAIKIDVDTKGGNVTLYGPAPTPAARDKAAALAMSIKGVLSVNNKLTVKSG